MKQPQVVANNETKPQVREAAAEKPSADPGVATKDVAQTTAAKPAGPQAHTVFFRAEESAAKIPPVKFSTRELALNKVKVGDSLPAVELPKIGGGKAKLTELQGKKATVVVFWKSDRRMAREQLADIGPDVIDPFEKEGVAVVGIAVNESADAAAKSLSDAKATFTNLVDADGKNFAEVGSERLPRTYVLDPSGKIVWFDTEYSLTTRRELHTVLRVLTESK